MMEPTFCYELWEKGAVEATVMVRGGRTDGRRKVSASRAELLVRRARPTALSPTSLPPSVTCSPPVASAGRREVAEKARQAGRRWPCASGQGREEAGDSDAFPARSGISSTSRGSKEPGGRSSLSCRR
jgi:hypothetical protein